MLDQTPSAGATPAAAGATPAQTTPVSPAAGTAPAAPETPATGEPDGLGDAGKRAIDRMKAERDAAQTAAKAASDELAALKLASASDSEKAISQAKKDGATETRTSLEGQIRRSEVKAALVAEGINRSVLDLAVNAPDFAALKVGESGVEGLDTAVAAFKKDRADLFAAPGAAGGSSDGGARGGTKVTKEQVIAWSKDPVEYEKHRDEIMAAQAQGLRS